MPPVKFEPTISAGERPQTYALDRAATGAGIRGEMAVTNSESRKPVMWDVPWHFCHRYVIRGYSSALLPFLCNP